MAKIIRAEKHPVNTLFHVLHNKHTFVVSIENDVLDTLSTGQIKTMAKAIAAQQDVSGASTSIPEWEDDE